MKDIKNTFFFVIKVKNVSANNKNKQTIYFIHRNFENCVQVDEKLLTGGNASSHSIFISSKKKKKIEKFLMTTVQLKFF